ncbi:malate dehydrogenase, mitochondrial-like [Diachasmimorpha longicaudata]|uniref:malate dehydrogenase, mitochondrial-like n=1 Tax=Diachasmimorpha longicaudata TaxID=58733 RepID=UPI0030B8C958
MNVLCKFRVHGEVPRFSIPRKAYSNQAKLDDSMVKTAGEKPCAEGSGRKLSVGILGGGMTPIFTAVLLKQSKILRNINIVDVSNSLSGAVFDAGHIDTNPKIKYYRKSSMKAALSNVDIIALMDNTDGRILSTEPKLQLMMSSTYIKEMGNEISKINPSALLAVFARPVTATVPLISEIFQTNKCWDPNKILGSVALDTMRIESMAANLFYLNSSFLSIPVVGGADPSTIVPLLTKAKPLTHISQEQEKVLVNQWRACDRDLENCTDDFKGPAMSSGAAAAKFISTIARALIGEPNVRSCAYVRSDIIPLCRFFANEVELGRTGVKYNCGLPKVSPIAENLVQRAIPVIMELSDMACASPKCPKDLKICEKMWN